MEKGKEGVRVGEGRNEETQRERREENKKEGR